MRHTGTTAFETQRLLCRRFMPGDERDMLKNWAADPDVQLEYGEPVYSSPGAVGELLAGYLAGYERPDFYRWAIVEKAGGENIGQIAFCRVYEDCRTAEIEYCIGKGFWGRGYAGEALAGLIGHAFSHTDFVKLEAYHRKENSRSGRVLARSAMRVTDTVERFARAGLSPEGEVCYCVRRERWEAAKTSEKGGKRVGIYPGKGPALRL